MERDEFLKTLGISFAMVCAGTCFEACGKKGDGGPDESRGGSGGGTNQVSVNISSLANVGSQTTQSGVLFFRIAAANEAASFVATEASCPHQGGNLSWIQGASKIQCNLHAASYTSAGAVTAQPSDGGSTRALKIYSVALSGTTLTATKA